LHHIALLHDVGKIGIHDSVITKPGFLTVAERDLMRLHPTIGASILSRAQILDRMVPSVLHHHEWVDGSGYPAGIKGDRIPLQSRILSVADAFDAMTSERSYRPRRPFERAMGELRAKAGTQFDPDVVDAFEGVAGEVASVCC
jgi:HD-GYP domain-containing protein (c-di-GMP phosphodiesterase class II)